MLSANNGRTKGTKEKKVKYASSNEIIENIIEPYEIIENIIEMSSSKQDINID